MFVALKRHILQQAATGALTPAQAFELLREITEAEVAPDVVASQPPDVVASQRPDVPLAIIGIGARMPGARGPTALWSQLRRGECVASAFPPARLWDVIRTRRTLWDQYRSTVEAGLARPLRGGFFPEVDGFDPEFFAIPRAEARVMGPAERLFLEVAWETFEDAGYTTARLRGSRTGIYLAHSPEAPFEYARLLAPDEPQGLVLNNPGSTGYRLAYWLDLRGPTVVVNTTCSSSLAVIHSARQALRAGDCELALVGGISLCVFPYFQDISDRAGLFSPDGISRAYAAGADGLGPGEGLGTLLLKPLDRALADGDPVRAVLRGSAMNSDGRSNGAAAPNPDAQADVLRRAWLDAGIDPAELSYIEGHGTGTRLGDTIEVAALRSALRSRPPGAPRCGLGSIKTNIGHLGDAAGVAGVLKVVLAMNHDELPPSLHAEQLNPLARLEDAPVEVVREARPWTGRRIAGVSSFGISGTNCHVVLESPPPARVDDTADAPLARPEVLLLSARSLGSLWRLAARYDEFLATTRAPLPTICRTAAEARDHHAYRLAIGASSRAELRRKLSRVVRVRQFETIPANLDAQAIGVARVEAALQTAYTPLPDAPTDDPRGWQALLRAYLTTCEVAFADFFGAAPYQRVALPTYCFDDERLWPRHEVQDTTDVDRLLFDLAWEPRPRPAAARELRPGHWVVLAPDAALGGALRDALGAAGRATTLVYAGDDFAVTGDDVTIDPCSPTDFDRLAAHLAALLAARADEALGGVVHAWACTPADAAMDTLEGVTTSQDRACLAGFRLARALARALPRRTHDFVVLAAGAHRLHARDAAPDPSRVTTFGLARVLSQEHPEIAVLGLDVDDLAPASVVEAFMSEAGLDRRTRDELVVLRGGVRHVEVVAPMAPVAVEPADITPRDGGVYVIAGGAGFLGLRLGKHLAEKARIHLVLIGRSRLPPREQWPAVLANADTGPGLREQLTRMIEIESLGAEVGYMAGDVTDPTQVQLIVDRVRRRHGRIDGVVVAMKQLYHKPIAELADEEFRAGIMNRVRGTWLLDRATRRDSLQFFVILSSISSVLGTKSASECCSVNQYLDVYGAWMRAQGQPAYVMNLTLILDDRRDFRGPTPIPPVSSAEFLAGFDRALARDLPFSLLASFDLAEIRRLLPVLKMHFSDALMARIRATPEPGEDLDESSDGRPNVADAAAASPGVPVAELGAIELGLAQICRELLGVEADRNHSFFNLGGTSLSVLSLVKTVRARWGVAFETTDVFEHASIAAMARCIRDRMAPAEPRAGVDLAGMLEQVEHGELSIDAALAALAGD